MYSDFDHFSPAVDYGAYPTYDTPCWSANDSWVAGQWEQVGVVEFDPVAEALTLPTPISPEAICIRACIDMQLAALESAQEPYTPALVALHGANYEPRLDPASRHYFNSVVEAPDDDDEDEDFDPNYDSRLDPESPDYMF